MATINGNSGNNNLRGTSAKDTLNGYGGNDTLNGGAGIDTLVGGEGNDIYIVDTTTDIIREYSGGGEHDTVRASVSYTLGNFLNDLTLTGTREINGTGNSYNNIITGNNANNILDGRGGIDTLIGGRGNDTYIVDSTTDRIVEYSNGGVDTVQSSVSYTLGAYVNNLTLTGTSAIDCIGNNLDNTITGNDADNVLNGGGGNDILDSNYSYGNSFIDNDILDGGVGNDTLIGGAIGILFGGAGDDNLSGGDYDAGGVYMNGDEGNDILRGVLSNIYGGSGNDTIIGNSSTVYGDDGNDVLDGAYSNLYGGSGNDTMIGNSATVYGDDGNDVLDGAYSNLYGGEGNDTLSGDYSNLYGGDGNDFLTSSLAAVMVGGNGNDTLTGDGGDDYFVFNAPTEGVDTIVNFILADEDQIVVSVSGFGGGLTAGDVITAYGPAIIPEQFVLGTAAVDASDRFIYNSANGALFFDIDGTGISEQVRFATLVGVPEITNNNIVVDA